MGLCINMKNKKKHIKNIKWLVFIMYLFVSLLLTFWWALDFLNITGTNVNILNKRKKNTVTVNSVVYFQTDAITPRNSWSSAERNCNSKYTDNDGHKGIIEDCEHISLKHDCIILILCFYFVCLFSFRVSLHVLMC